MDLAYHRVDHEWVSTWPGQVNSVVASVEGNGDFRPAKRFNRVPEHRVDVAIVQLDAALAGRGTGASEDDVNHPLLLLEAAG